MILLEYECNADVVNGTAAEHASLTVDERKAIAERWVKEGKGKLERIIIQVGTLNLPDSQTLVCIFTAF